MARFVIQLGSSIASAFVLLMYGTGYALQKLMTIRGGSYGGPTQALNLVGRNRTITIVLGTAVWMSLLICGSMALA